MLHAVGRAGGGGPVDSMRTGPDGRYLLRHAMRDTGAVYLVSATFRDITYFSGGLLAERDRDTVPELLVFDTSSTSPAIAVAERHLVVRQPEPDGTRRVLELLVLANRGRRTRIAPDAARPVWSGRLPRGAAQFETGESDVSAEAVVAAGDTVVVTAPIPPGDKQVLYTYVLPGRLERLELPVEQPYERLTILLEDTNATFEGNAPLEPRGVQVFEDAQFAMFDGRDVVAGATVTFRFAPRGLPPALLQSLLVGLAALALAGTLVVWLRRARPAAQTAEALAAEIAALDRALAARGTVSPAEQAAYEGRRARLKAQLETALASRRQDG